MKIPSSIDVRGWHVAAAAAVALFAAGAAVRLAPSKTAAAAEPPPPTPVPMQAAPSAPAPEEETYPGVLLAPAAVDLAATVEGRLSEVAVSAGDQVSAGVVVAKLDDKAARQALAVAKAGLGAAAADAQQARIEHALAKDRASRRGGVVQVGDETMPIVSPEEQKAAELGAQAARARAASAGSGAAERAARVQALAVLLEETQLRAPFDGVVAARYADPGTYVRAGQPVVRIISSAELRVRFAVPEEHATRIRAGLTYVAVLDGREIRATVSAIAPEVEPASRTIFVDGTASGIAGGEAAALAGRVVRVRTQAR